MERPRLRKQPSIQEAKLKRGSARAHLARFLCAAYRSVIMALWTCPDTRCAYNKQLQPGQNCPLCGKEAKGFKFNEFGSLLKKKDDFRKSIEKTKRQEQLLQRLKFCPKCGSPNINFLIFFRPSIWKCLNCGYEGAFVVEDSKLAEKIRRRCRKALEEEHD